MVEATSSNDNNTSSAVEDILSADRASVSEIRAEISQKYAAKKKFLVEGYRRAILEDKIHEKQKDYKRYHRLFTKYAYPINDIKFEPGVLSDRSTL